MTTSVQQQQLGWERQYLLNQELIPTIPAVTEVAAVGSDGSSLTPANERTELLIQVRALSRTVNRLHERIRLQDAKIASLHGQKTNLADLNIKLINHINRAEKPAPCQSVKDFFNRIFYPKWFAAQEAQRGKTMVERAEYMRDCDYLEHPST